MLCTLSLCLVCSLCVRTRESRAGSYAMMLARQTEPILSTAIIAFISTLSILLGPCFSFVLTTYTPLSACAIMSPLPGTPRLTLISLSHYPICTARPHLRRQKEPWPEGQVPSLQQHHGIRPEGYVVEAPQSHTSLHRPRTSSSLTHFPCPSLFYDQRGLTSAGKKNRGQNGKGHRYNNTMGSGRRATWLSRNTQSLRRYR